jgi:hypothetical protein
MKIETRKRGLSLSDALAIAAALGIAPVDLITPKECATLVSITPHRVADPERARSWLRGVLPLTRADAKLFLLESTGDDDLYAALEAATGARRNEIDKALRLLQAEGLVSRKDDKQTS